MRLQDHRYARRGSTVIVVAFWLSYLGVLSGLFLWLGVGAAVTWLSFSVFVLTLLLIA